MRTAPLYVLYRVFGTQGELLYVGATTNPSVRFLDHHDNQSWWEDAALITLQHIADLAALEVAETEAIKTESPRYNQIHSKPPTWSRKPRGERGQGYVFQRSQDGRWIGRIELEPVDGKRQRRTVSALTREDAERKLNALKKRLGNS